MQQRIKIAFQDEINQTGVPVRAPAPSCGYSGTAGLTLFDRAYGGLVGYPSSAAEVSFPSGPRAGCVDSPYGLEVLLFYCANEHSFSGD